MRSLSKISLAILAGGFLVFAGSAFAQEMAKPQMTITGDIDAAFGSFSFDKTSDASSPAANQKAYSEFVTSWESNIRFTWKTDEAQAIVRYRVRGNNEGSGGSGNAAANATSSLQSGGAYAAAADDVYHEVWWTPGAFKLGIGKFQGQAWSQPMAGEYILNNPIGEGVYWMNWTGISGLDAESNVGAVQIGVAISSQCRPSCNTAQSNNTVKNTEDNTSSIVPHLTGTFGSISIAAQLPQTAGTINNSGAVTTTTPAKSTDPLQGAGIDKTSSKSVSGSGYQAGVKWVQGGLKVAVDVSGFTDAKLEALGQAKDRLRSGIAARVDVPAGPGSVMLAYFTLDDNGGGSTTYTFNETTLRYTIPASFINIIPEFRTVTNGGALASATGGKNKDTTNSEFRLILQAPIL